MYFFTFIDDDTHKVWVYPMADKDAALIMFYKFLALIKNQFGKKLKCLRKIDKNGEYVGREFRSFCNSKDITMEWIASYMLAHNGVEERMNRTIQEIFQALGHKQLQLLLIWQISNSLF